MLNLFFLVVAGLALSLYLGWGFLHLPGEKWQILASFPISRRPDGGWNGINLTYYGLLTANAYLAAVAMALILLGSVGVHLADVITLVALLLLCCVPASRWMARWVEGKAHTFTVGGAAFVGILIAPWLVALVNHLPWRKGAVTPVLPALAAIVVAYCFGEGLGRLACISFGCCYGKPLSQCHPLIQRLFSRRCFVFSGKTKKIAYAGGLEGERVLPVQALTAILYVAAGLSGAGLFLASRFAEAFLLGLFVTQLWRFFSEFLRADYRGEGKISVYQVLNAVGLAYAVVTAVFFGSEMKQGPDLASGFAAFWNPLMIPALQGLWLTIFIYTGRSEVTGARLSFHVHGNRI
ncbi:MAG: prolipoprotein diacylglyceryl transferase [Deltaproteobacteria bacterium]|nr:prolipoprotein diacylglyceryl transferase [Deltaproteobacteria bacterium]